MGIGGAKMFPFDRIRREIGVTFKDSNFNAVLQQAPSGRTGRPVMGWSARGWEGPVRRAPAWFWVAVGTLSDAKAVALCADASPPVPVDSPCPAGRISGTAPTCSPADRTHTRGGSVPARGSKCPRQWGGPRADATGGGAVGSSRCSRMRWTEPGSVTKTMLSGGAPHRVHL